MEGKLRIPDPVALIASESLKFSVLGFYIPTQTDPKHQLSDNGI